MKANFALNLICITIIFFLTASRGTAQDNLNSRSNCNLNLPVVRFRGTEVAIKSQHQAYLKLASRTIKDAPECNIKVSGYGAASKIDQQRSWDRVNAVIRYLVEKTGISEQRFIFEYGQEGGNANEVHLTGTSEEGPRTVPAPHPNLHRLN